MLNGEATVTNVIVVVSKPNRVQTHHTAGYQDNHSAIKAVICMDM